MNLYIIYTIYTSTKLSNIKKQNTLMRVKEKRVMLKFQSMFARDIYYREKFITIEGEY